MITSNIENFETMRSTKAKVELYQGSTLVTTCTCENVLSDFSVSREGETGKFFGFGVCHKLQMKLIDLNRVLRIYEGYTAKVGFGDGTLFDFPYPDMTLDSIKVDMKTGDINVIAYDPIYKASELTYAELYINTPYTIQDLAEGCARLLGVTLSAKSELTPNLSYSEGGNYDKNDTTPIRIILNQIAEVTQTIYFIDNNNELMFKKLSSVSVHDYDKSQYYELITAEPKVLKGICHATELGENLEATAAGVTTGVTQFIRNNPLLELRNDLPTLLQSFADGMGGFTLHQYDLDWSGDYRLEIGDLISVYSNEVVTPVYILNDVISYAGTVSETSNWEYTTDDAESFTNPVTLGDKLNQTFAKVDKMEKEITLYVGEVVDTVVADKIDTAIDAAIDGFDQQLNNLSAAVNATNGKIDEVEADITGLQNVQVTHTENITQLQLTTQGITGEVTQLKEETEVLSGDIDNAKTDAINEAIAESKKLINTTASTLRGEISTAEDNAVAESKDYTDAQDKILAQSITSTKAEIKVTTDGITQRLNTAEETLLTKVDTDDVYSKAEVYTKTETDSKINVAKEEIELSVSKSYETISKVEEKIEETKVYAEEQAQSAKTDAITEAATDAQEKADQAELDANGYTDSKITTVITTLNEKVAEIKVTTDAITQRVSAEEEKTVAIESDIEELNGSVTTNTNDIGALEVQSNSISASVESFKETTKTGFGTMSEEISSISQKLSTTMTSEQVEVLISKSLDNGISSVTTSTGFTFNDEGLHISKSNSQMSSTLDEEGLEVSKSDTPVLTAKAEGVNALNLTSRQYLSVGNCRFEKYGSKRMGCYWIGG